MSSLKERYQELLSLTQLYILREHTPKDWCLAMPSSYAFFQSTLMQRASSPLVKPPSLRPLEIPLTSALPPSNASSSSKPLFSQPKPEPVTPSPDPLPTPPVFPDPNPLQPSIPSPPPPAPPPPRILREQKTLALEPVAIASLPAVDNQGFKQLLNELFPHYPLCEKILDDRIAQKIKNTWHHEQAVSPIIILSFNDQDRQLTFLKNVAKAISLYLAPARVISSNKLEKDKQWEKLLTDSHLRLVIASDYNLYLQPGLMKYYREIPQQSKHYLHQTPLLLLSDLDLYLQKPQLKTLLWRAICNELASFQAPRAAH